MYVIQHFPEISSLAQMDPMERLHSNALEFARRWKDVALAKSKTEAAGAGAGSVNNETESLLLTGPAENLGMEEELER